MKTWTRGHRELRERLLTQSELARRCGCSQQAINRILHGGRPKVALARKLREVLGIDEGAWTDDQAAETPQSGGAA